MRKCRRALSRLADGLVPGLRGQGLVVGDPLPEGVARPRAQPRHAAAGSMAARPRRGGPTSASAIDASAAPSPLGAGGPELVQQAPVPVVRHQRVGVLPEQTARARPGRAAKASRAVARAAGSGASRWSRSATRISSKVREMLPEDGEAGDLLLGHEPAARLDAGQLDVVEDAQRDQHQRGHRRPAAGSVERWSWPRLRRRLGGRSHAGRTRRLLAPAPSSASRRGSRPAPGRCGTRCPGPRP